MLLALLTLFEVRPKRQSEWQRDEREASCRSAVFVEGEGLSSKCAQRNVFLWDQVLQYGVLFENCGSGFSIATFGTVKVRSRAEIFEASITARAIPQDYSQFEVLSLES